MRKILSQLSVLFTNTGRSKLKALCYMLVCCCIISGVSAQDLKPEAQRQIDFLTKEKKSRTSAQKKIAANILLTYKMQNDLSMRSNLPDLKFDEVKINAGKIKVDIAVAVSAQVLNALKALDCDIVFSSEKFASITANVPLNKIEQIAALAAVKYIQLWMAPVHNNGEPFNIPAAVDTTVRPDFNERANNVKNFITDVVGQNKNNPAFPANNPPFTTNAIPGTGAGSVISEAVATHKADVVQANFGIKGAGIKIGVLSNGVDGYATSQASGDLPPVINILPGQAGSASEGRAMMELIHDIAPDAELYYATALISQANFAQNILDLRAAGCDIIVDDVSYYAEGVFQDDNVAQSINTVTASGALYFSSAGNSGNKNDGTAGVWEGDFVDGGPAPSPIGSANGNVNNFGGVLYNTITLNSGNPISLKWSDPLAHSANDYDLYAVNSTGTSVLTASTNTQDGTQNPYEIIAGVAAGSRIYVVKFSGDVRALHLNTNRSRLSVSTSGVTGGHNAALNAYSVAATPAAAPFYADLPKGPYPYPFNAANAVEGFSSDGPRRMFFNPDGSEITPGNILFSTNGGVLLQKPDITAADGNATNTAGFQPFYGTSAAAPNAAAIAALIKSAVPGITPAQIRTALTGSAIDIEAPGTDRDAGAGIIMAPEALVAAGFSPSTPAFNLNNTTVTEGSFSNSNGAVEPGETGNLVINLLNNGATANGVQAVLTSTTPGVTITQNTVAFGSINTAGEANNSASPFVLGLNASVACGGIIDFTLSVTYDGSSTPTVLTFTYKTGKTPAAIVATLGGAPATGPSFTSSSDMQTGRLFRNSIASTCAALKANPGISGTASLAYHAYTFTNTTPVSQCVDVTMASDGTKFHLAYNNNGFIRTAVSTNYLADPGGSGTLSTFRFEAPAGQNFTIVVNDVAGGTVNPYTLNVGLVTCSTPPACTPINITNPGTKTVTVNTPYTETLATTGGSGAYTYSVTGTLPAGLTLVGNTISGTPTEAGSYTITVNAADAAGCTTGTVTYQLDVVEAPAITATGTFETFTACEGSASPEQSFTVEGTNLTDNITVTAPAGFEVSSVSGSGFGSSVMLTPTSGTVTATTLYVVKAASAPDNVNGIISVTSAGATTQELAVNGVTNAATTWYADADGDGYGNPASSVQACEAPANYVANNDDCDDLNGSTYPGAPELCDGVDNDCDGAIDEDFPLVTYYFDVDGDGYGSPNNPVQARCFQPANTVTNNLDCDDQQASVYPGAPEVCDGIDNDCDGEIDEDFPLVTYYFDVDGDGFGSPNNPVQARCFQPINTVTNNLDCDDQHASVYPGAPELCDGMDNDCDGFVDEDFPLITYYFDTDGDGYGNPNSPIQARCIVPIGTVNNNLDCDDNNPAVNPGAAEICGNGIDDNCNGQVDENCTSNIRLNIPDKAKREGNGQRAINFIVKLNRASTQTVQVSYATQNITAVAGSDYVATSGTLTFAPGVRKQTITVVITGDRVAEPDETFRILLSNAVNAGIADNEAIGTIINDDGTSLTATVAPATIVATMPASLKVSPNPATTTLYVQLNGYKGNVTLQLRTIEGKVLIQEKLQTGNAKMTQQKMNVANLPNGVYLLTAIDEKGKVRTEKVIISR